MPKRKSKGAVASDSDENNSSADDYGGPTQKTQRQKSKMQRRRTKLMTKNTNSSSDNDSDFVSANNSKAKKVSAKCPRKSVSREMVSQAPAAVLDGCGISGCDASGHINGIDATHHNLISCPTYHNLTPRLCEVLHEEQQKSRVLKRGINTRSPGREQHEFQMQLTEERRRRTNLKEPDRTAMFQFTKRWDKLREPLLEKVASPMDLLLFREAQALVCKHKEYVVAQHHMLAYGSESRLREIEMGPHLMATWYDSPYPDEYNKAPKLYICQFCLKYMKTAIVAQRHAVKCPWQHPPGNEIYRKDNISFFEVDGQKQRTYCQNLCLLAKLFLNYKTLYYKVEPFLFYVMTTNDSTGCHTVGYFSKEKNCYLNYNVSCILTLPQYMRQGFGKMLIEFSYLLTKREGKIGSPEKPLSDLGLISYRSYWKDVLLDHLGAHDGTEICIKDLSHETAINSNDIISTLQSMGMLKYWKGKHIILKKDDIFEEFVKKKSRRAAEDKQQRSIDPVALRWLPPKFDVNSKAITQP